MFSVSVAAATSEASDEILRPIIKSSYKSSGDAVSDADDARYRLQGRAESPEMKFEKPTSAGHLATLRVTVVTASVNARDAVAAASRHYSRSSASL